MNGSVDLHHPDVMNDNEAEFWQQVEGYFHDYIGVDFSHGLCPECLKQVYGKYLEKNSPAGAS